MAPNVASSPRLALQIMSPTEHLLAYHALMANPLSAVWSSSKRSESVEETKQKLISRQQPPGEPWKQVWAIMLKVKDQNGDYVEGNERLIGAIGFPREAEMGYRIMPEEWRKGYMSEALVVFSDLFWRSEENAKYDKLLAAADTKNVASQRVLEKAGFSKGELKIGAYEMAANPGVKSDLQYYFLERPQK